jgi:hypothetical protein
VFAAALSRQHLAKPASQSTTTPSMSMSTVGGAMRRHTAAYCAHMADMANCRLPRANPASPSALRSAGSAAHRRMAPTKAASSPSGSTKPSTPPPSSISGMPAMSVVMTGMARTSASAITIGVTSF